MGLLGIEIATPEHALSRGEILRLRLRMTGSEGAHNDMVSYYPMRCTYEVLPVYLNWTGL